MDEKPIFVITRGPYYERDELGYVKDEADARAFVDFANAEDGYGGDNYPDTNWGYIEFEAFDVTQKPHKWYAVSAEYEQYTNEATYSDPSQQTSWGEVPAFIGVVGSNINEDTGVAYFHANGWTLDEAQALLQAEIDKVVPSVPEPLEIEAEKKIKTVETRGITITVPPLPGGGSNKLKQRQKFVALDDLCRIFMGEIDHFDLDLRVRDYLEAENIITVEAGTGLCIPYGDGTRLKQLIRKFYPHVDLD